jgi:glycosyltransferase involved in cell wall biosynthesis
VKVFGLPVGADGCGYYRCYQPLAELRRRGHNVMLPERGMVWLPDAELNAGDIDVFAGQLLTGPRGMELWESWAGKTRLVYDIDDDVFSSDHEGSLWHRLPECRDIAAYLISISDLVTVSTEPLVDVVKRYNSNVAVLPNCVHEDLLKIGRPARERVTVGWSGGTSHLRDFRYAAPMISKFVARHPGVDFHFVGADYSLIREWKAPSTIPRSTGQVRHTPWTPDVWDFYRGVDFDVGLAPLDPAGKFNRCKSFLRALEYAARGIPVVASACEAYSGFVRHGVTGFLVKYDHEWGRYLRDLVNDQAMREEMGAAAKRLAQEWTIQKRYTAWQAAYEGVMDRVPVP